MSHWSVGRRVRALAVAMALGALTIGAITIGALGVHAATLRRDVPWVVVVRAVPSASAGAGAACPPAMAPLVERGARCAVAGAAGGALVIAEGPPELEAEIARVISAGPGRVFSEGRTPPTRADAKVTAPVPGPVRMPGGAGPGGGGITPGPTAGRAVLPLAPTASLWDVEGDALVLLVKRALPQLKDGDTALGFAPGRAWLEVNAAPNDVVSALTPLADKQLGPTALAQLELAARASLAERRARVGSWSTDAARAWLVCGDACVPPSMIGAGVTTDLGARLRARLITAAIR